MSDTSDRVPVTCPSCSPHERVAHEVLAEGGQFTVRCTDCDHVHKERIEPPEEVEVDVVVSQGEESWATTYTAVAEGTVETGDEFVVDTEAAIQQVRVTSVEVGEEQRAEAAEVTEAETVWTRVVDNVGVNVTVHPAEGDGRHSETRSERVFVPGDYELTVGDVEEFGDLTAAIEGVQLRDEVADDYRFEKLEKSGDTAFAKDVKRVYARDEQRSAWSAW
ncbi:MAG: HVO_0476 family zinc finger protein [Halolamina sp.]